MATFDDYDPAAPGINGLPLALLVGGNIIGSLARVYPAGLNSEASARARARAQGASWVTGRAGQAVFHSVWNEVKANRNEALDRMPYYRAPAKRYYSPWRAAGERYITQLAFVQQKLDPSTEEPVGPVYTVVHEQITAKRVPVRDIAVEWIARSVELPPEGNSLWVILAVFPVKLYASTGSRRRA